MDSPIEGLIAATFTPFHSNGSLYPELIPTLVDRQIDEGVEGFFVGGSTGEGVSMTVNERKMVAEEFVKATRKRIPVIVHVGRDALHEAQALASHAVEIGADAISAVPPSYFTPSNERVLINCLKSITDVAPSLPFYYYHIPRLTGAAFDMPSFIDLATQKIPSLAGIKYSAFDVDRFQACIDQFGSELKFFYGSDEMFLAGLSVGAHGQVGSTYNYMAPLFLKIREAYTKNDTQLARSLQSKAVQIIHTSIKYKGVPGLKATMRASGIDCGPNRLPLDTLNEEEFASLEKDLDAIDFSKARMGEV